VDAHKAGRVMEKYVQNTNQMMHAKTTTVDVLNTQLVRVKRVMQYVHASKVLKAMVENVKSQMLQKPLNGYVIQNQKERM